MSAIDSASISDATAHAFVVQCPRSSWWLSGWHRASIRRLLDEALPATDKATLKALMRHKKAIRRLDETNALDQRTGRADHR
jgi:hypothetical protein